MLTNVKNFNSTGKEKTMFLYFSNLMEREVVDVNGQLVGHIYDIVLTAEGIYPQAKNLIVRKGFPNRVYALIDWSSIVEFSPKQVRLNLLNSNVVFNERHDNKSEFTIRRDILDQQVVDTYNHKVIRVNDVHLLAVDNLIMLAHVDISTKGIVRRLGFEKFVDFLVKIINPKSNYLNIEHLISCKYIQTLSINPVSMSIRINLPQKQWNNIPAADLGEIFLDLNTKEQLALFKSLDLNSKGKVFINIDLKTQESLIQELGVAEIATILNAVPPDEATDFLEKLPKDEVRDFLAIMENKQAKKLSELLGYSSDSAGGLMTTEFFSFKRGTLIQDVINQIREKSFKVEPVQFAYITDDGNKLVGSITFKGLMLANNQDTIEKYALAKTYFVNLHSSVKEVAYLMEKYKYNSIPVVDENNILKGIITVDDILSQLIAIAWRRLKKINITPKQ